ncbi:MAG: hypothetical protein PHQ91_10375 [Thermoanaerobaculaceae bacterium]|nr:hypothetical protein [Thermoanaerobaculaceae bacterium]
MRAALPAAVVLIVAASVAAAGDDALLPASGFAGGWTRAGQAKVFPADALYNHIDGGAEIFLELGFELATVQRYARGADEIVVECYRMRDADAALAVYLDKCGDETPSPAFAERHTAGRYQLLFVRDRFFVIVNNPPGTPAVAPALVEFARAIAGRLPPGAEVRAFDALPRVGLVPGSLRLIRGSVGLQEIATLGEGDILRLGGTLTATAARYTGGAAGDRTLVVVVYPSEVEAAGAFRNLVDHLDPEIRPLTTGERRLVFASYDGTFGVAARAGARLELTLRLKTRPLPE